MLLEFGVYAIKHSFAVLVFTTIFGFIIALMISVFTNTAQKMSNNNSNEENNGGQKPFISKGLIIYLTFMSLFIMFVLNLFVAFLTVHTWNQAPIHTEQVIKSKLVSDGEYTITTKRLKNEQYNSEDPIKSQSVIHYKHVGQYIKPISNKEYTEIQKELNSKEPGALNKIINSAVDSQKKRFENK